MDTQASLPVWAINLKRLRLERGYSQEVFGRKFGVSKMAVSYWENAKTEPPLLVFAWMLEANGQPGVRLFFNDMVDL